MTVPSLPVQIPAPRTPVDIPTGLAAQRHDVDEAENPGLVDAFRALAVRSSASPARG